jgi:hypothetical protein
MFRKNFTTRVPLRWRWNEEQRVAIVRVLEVLQVRELGLLLREQRLVARLRIVQRVDPRRPFPKIELRALFDAELLDAKLHAA